MNQQDTKTLLRWRELQKEVAQIHSIRNHREKSNASKSFVAQCGSFTPTLMRFIMEHREFMEEFEAYSKNLEPIWQYMNSSETVLEERSKEYFQILFAERLIDIRFLSKPGGIQIGRKALLNLGDKEVAYFIKTHQDGSASGVSNIKLVDPKELFIYKFLEFSKFGPECHFFYNQLSQGGFYIATKDCGADGDFLTYEKFRAYLRGERIDKMYDYENIHVKLTKHNLYQYLTIIDFICRIFCLTDASTNPTNFGFLFTREEIKAQIIDFRILTSNRYVYDNIFEDFLNGNGLFFYYDEIFIAALKQTSSRERILMIKQILSEHRTNILISMQQAYDYTVAYMRTNINYMIANDDLQKYYSEITINIKSFEKSLYLRSE